MFVEWTLDNDAVKGIPHNQLLIASETLIMQIIYGGLAKGVLVPASNKEYFEATFN